MYQPFPLKMITMSVMAACQQIGQEWRVNNGFPDFPVDGALCRATNDRMKG